MNFQTDVGETAVRQLLTTLPTIIFSILKDFCLKMNSYACTVTMLRMLKVFREYSWTSLLKKSTKMESGFVSFMQRSLQKQMIYCFEGNSSTIFLPQFLFEDLCFCLFHTFRGRKIVLPFLLARRLDGDCIVFHWKAHSLNELSPMEVTRFQVTRLPWNEQEVGTDPETSLIKEQLVWCNSHGILTINSQPAVNGAPSTDPLVGWGKPDGYCYQRVCAFF